MSNNISTTYTKDKNQWVFESFQTELFRES